MKTRTLAAIVLAVVALGILGFGARSLARVWQMKHEVNGLEREIAGLRIETEQLTATVTRLKSDPETLEQLAREKLGLVKPGEKVLMLPPSPGAR